jgi:hypothetical protein
MVDFGTVISRSIKQSSVIPYNIEKAEDEFPNAR